MQNLDHVSLRLKGYVVVSSGLVLTLLYITMTSHFEKYEMINFKKHNDNCHRTLDFLMKDVYQESERNEHILNEEELVQIKRFGWSSPIDVQKYKLIFFQIEKAGCTQWKKLLQLIQNISKPNGSDVHNPGVNGLRYLTNYNEGSIRQFIFDPKWTKATIVREPRSRVLSAYFQFSISTYYKKYISKKKPSFSEFLQYITYHSNAHWSSQIRMPLWLYRNVMIGKLENIQGFGIRLLKKIGAWDEWGTKWGPWKNETVFASVFREEKRSRANEKLRMYYTHELEDIVFNLYSREYELFNYSCSYISKK